MHKEKIEQLEKAINLKGATPEMKAKFQAAIDKLKAEENVKPKEEPETEKVKNITIAEVAKSTNFKYQKVSKVDYKMEPGNAGLKAILRPFSGKDELRPAMMNVFLDESGATCTNAHILLHISGKPAKKGLFNFDGKEIQGQFPKYKYVVPTKNETIEKVNVSELFNYAFLCEKSKLYNPKTQQTTLAYNLDGENTKIGVNINLLKIVCKALLKISNNNDWYAQLSTPNRAILFTNHNRTVRVDDDTYSLVMPIMVYDGPFGLYNEEENKAMQAHWYFSKNSIIENGKVVNLIDLTDSKANPEEKKKEERPAKQAITVKKAVAEKKVEKEQTDLADEMQAAIDNATKSSEAWQHNKVLDEAQKFQKLRNKSAKTLDDKSDSKRRLTPTRENLVRWMKNPGAFDMIGVDTFKGGDATADLKIKKEIWWHKIGIKYNG